MSLLLYVHVPFCEKKCHYCDFASWKSPSLTQRKWLETALTEIGHTGRTWQGDKEVRTVFFGGGTPSVVPVSYLEQLLGKLREFFDLSRVQEMTLEANPGTLTKEKLKAWRELGFDRISLGVQSFDAEELKLLGRVHSPKDAQTALELLASEPGLRFSGDLIFGLPGQTPERFLANLEMLLRYNPGHVSFYGLTIEPNTVFDRWRKEGSLILPDGESYRALYRAGVGLLEQYGAHRYEVSNFAWSGEECLHNQGYWDNVPYLAFGPGAHGYDGARRWMNPRDLEDYLRWGERGFPGSGREWDELDANARLCEAVFLGLRQVRGFSIAEVERNHGVRWPGSAFVKWERSGHLLRENGSIRLRDDGWLLLDEIVADLLAHARRTGYDSQINCGVKSM
jgi:oxygen-independent coproporphyrinogen-3 oxidase